MPAFSHLQIRNPKDDETPIEAASQIFSSLFPSYVSQWKRFLHGDPKTYGFEIYLLGQTIYFYATTPQSSETFMHSLIASSFPQCAIKKTTDPMDIVFNSKYISVGEVVLNSSFYLPTKTYMDFKDIDPMSSLLGFLAKQDPHIKFAVQILTMPAYFPWQAHVVEAAKKHAYDKDADKYGMSPQKLLIMQKAAFQGGKCVVRLIAGTNDPGIPTMTYLQNLAGTFGAFSLGEGNQFAFKKVWMFKDRFIERIKQRRISYFEHQNQILNAQELATIWHPPGFLLAGIKNVAWGKTLAGEPPLNIPVADNLNDSEKQEVNFFAKAEYKNKESIFGIKDADRRKHIYIIGKTGAGKSTLIANMAIDDIRKGRGIGIIDPHGDLCEIILDYIPKRRLNDVVYLEPFDTERPFSLNVLEVRNSQQKDLVASGIVSIFYKLYKDSWGPRLEYILRNIILTLLETPGATLVDVLSLIANADYRKKVVNQLKDPVLRDFWLKEYDRMPDKLKAEAVSPIQNKVGQFVSSKMVRNIVGREKSSINLEEIMNEGKILLLNLSQGKMGEDNAALLGAMIITQIQLAAMNRSFIKEEDRKDFFLYVDEFQNFATSSFIKILSEARKYRLALTLANQYIEQLEEEVSHAIFGNVGTLISFVVGARDAYILSKEYGEIYTEGDMVSLGKHEVVMKLSIDNMTSAPFPATTLPLPALKNDNREKIIRLSKERFGKKIDNGPETSQPEQVGEMRLVRPDRSKPLPVIDLPNQDKEEVKPTLLDVRIPDLKPHLPTAGLIRTNQPTPKQDISSTVSKPTIHKQNQAPFKPRQPFAKQSPVPNAQKQPPVQQSNSKPPMPNLPSEQPMHPHNQKKGMSMHSLHNKREQQKQNRKPQGQQPAVQFPPQPSTPPSLKQEQTKQVVSKLEEEIKKLSGEQNFMLKKKGTILDRRNG